MAKVTHTDEQKAQLRMFGFFPGTVDPVICRKWSGIDACSQCRGFGSSGNPLCGAVYTCQSCKGTGMSMLRRTLNFLRVG